MTHLYCYSYRIHLINNEIVRAGEILLPGEKDLLTRFRESNPDDHLDIGDEDSGQAFIPVRNIMYISKSGKCRR